ncbi:Protein F55G1.15, partial [Aphelenchoides avenae]
MAYHMFVRIVCYGLMAVCICANVIALLARTDTAYYLHLYTVISSLLLVSAMGAMYAFIVVASRSTRKLCKSEMHGQTLVTLIVLSIGVAFGCSFRGVFLMANKDCDEIVDAIESNAFELAIDVMDCGLMTAFPFVALFYLFQRSAHGILDATWRHDYAIRTWINVSIGIVWIKILVQKGYVHLK